MRNSLMLGMFALLTTAFFGLSMTPADAQRMLSRQHVDGHSVMIPECRDHACCKRNAKTLGRKYDAKFCAERIKLYGR